MTQKRKSKEDLRVGDLVRRNGGRNCDLKISVGIVIGITITGKSDKDRMYRVKWLIKGLEWWADVCDYWPRHALYPCLLLIERFEELP